MQTRARVLVLWLAATAALLASDAFAIQIGLPTGDRLCVDLESAETVEDRPIASGAGRRIVWRNVAPDPGCDHFDFLLQSICA
jgi:hypothetical protein